MYNLKIVSSLSIDINIKINQKLKYNKTTHSLLLA